MRPVCTVFALSLFVACSGPGKPSGGGVAPGNGGGSIDAGAAAPTDAAAVSTKPTVDKRAEMVRDLAALQFHKLGNPVLRWDHIPKVLAPKSRPHKLLVVLVEFADRGFERFRGKRNQGRKLAAYYQKALFDDTYSQIDTLSHYYANQSGGKYHVTGTVLTPIKLSKPRAAYGGPSRPAGGSWRNDSDAEGMVEEALKLAAKRFPELTWSDFDRWDPKDYDGDGNLDEADGYLDHFVLVFAGGGQASCQVLHKLDAVFTPNAKPDVVKTLTKRQLECATRLWPHRFKVQKRESQGPTIGGTVNRQGGVPLSESLWVSDYNMQSEYIGPPTFIHEFGHSIGLPDVYSRSSSNSTGPWEVMSSTADDSPQSLSSWSRLMLGWLTPKVIVPPEFGGARSVTAHLRTLDDASAAPGADRAVMVVLPPKRRVIDLMPLPVSSGSWALYSGQGNDMNRKAELRLDLTAAKAGKLELSFDAWWEIEAGWDFAYVEVSADQGQSWKRIKPVDKRHMPAKHGHDGKGTVPGFTGLSGDLDGDGKNESNRGCDPKKKIAHGEDKASAKKSACLAPTFVRVAFDLSSLRGKKARVRVRYFTDGAAVMRGIVIDNVRVTGRAVAGGDFEGDLGPAWKLDGWSKTPGRHDLLVPHFYLIEHRDPYASPGAKGHRYDRTLSQEYYRFYYDTVGKRMVAAVVRNRPGVVVWYYNGAWAWSENDPGDNGPGEGYLLAVDSNPNEIPLVGWEGFLKGKPAENNTHYDITSDRAQAALRTSFFHTVCFVRNRKYMPKSGLPKTGRPRRCARGDLSRLRVGGKRMMFSYQVINETLPGGKRKRYKAAGELVEVRTRKSKKVYRLRMRSLRHLNTQDAPFSLTPHKDGVTFYEVKGRKLVKLSSRAHPARAAFDDSKAWVNPKLPFGGVKVPKVGFGFELVKPGPDAPAGTRAKVELRWKK